MTRPSRSSEAQCLLSELRKAGSHVFVEDGQLFCSPPLRSVNWPDDAQEAIELWYAELLTLVQHERVTVH
jgi:hypothetical protein